MCLSQFYIKDKICDMGRKLPKATAFLQAPDGKPQHQHIEEIPYL